MSDMSQAELQRQYELQEEYKIRQETKAIQDKLDALAKNKAVLTIDTIVDGELTQEDLENMEPDTMFAHGTVSNSPDGIYMTNSNIGRILKWCAVRRGIPDWSVYVYWDDSCDYDYVKSNGDTVSDKSNIKKLVPCTEEALKMYAL